MVPQVLRPVAPGLMEAAAPCKAAGDTRMQVLEEGRSPGSGNQKAKAWVVGVLAIAAAAAADCLHSPEPSEVMETWVLARAEGCGCVPLSDIGWGARS